MNDQNEINFFNKYKDDLEFSNEIDIKLYFIEVKYKLTKQDPDKFVFAELVDKTKKLLKLCVPNRKDIHKEFNEKLDIELITNYLKHDIYDKRYFLNIIETIIGYVKRFHSPDNDNSLDKFKFDCYKKLESNQFYKVFLPSFFMEIFFRLKTVIKQRRDFFELTIKNKN